MPEDQPRGVATATKGGTMGFESQTLGQSMIRLFMSYIPTGVIYAAAKLEITDHIGDEGTSAQGLAQKLKVDSAALYRVMRVLTGLGVLRQDENERFYVTPFHETLREDSPQSVRDYAIYNYEIIYLSFKEHSGQRPLRQTRDRRFFRFSARQSGAGSDFSRRDEQSGTYRNHGHPRRVQIF